MESGEGGPGGKGHGATYGHLSPLADMSSEEFGQMLNDIGLKELHKDDEVAGH